MSDRYELVIGASFSASHRLRMPDGCVETAHTHEWRVEVFLEGGELDSEGLLADFTTLEGSLAGVVGGLGGADLNGLEAFRGRNPSTEEVARYIHDCFTPLVPQSVRVSKVRVWETPDCAAAYVPGPRR